MCISRRRQKAKRICVPAATGETKYEQGKYSWHHDHMIVYNVAANLFSANGRSFGLLPHRLLSAGVGGGACSIKNAGAIVTRVRCQGGSHCVARTTRAHGAGVCCSVQGNDADEEKEVSPRPASLASRLSLSSLAATVPSIQIVPSTSSIAFHPDTGL